MGVEMTGKDETLPGGGMMGQTPLRHHRGGGMTGQTPWRHLRGGGGGWDKHPVATPLPHPDSMQSECDFDTQLHAATALQVPHADGVAHSPLFFVRADGKAHMMLAGGDGFTKESPGAIVCHCCGANREKVLRKFGGKEVALEGIKGHIRLTGVFRDIPADLRVRDFGAHGVMRVAIAGVNGIVRVLVTHGGVSRKSAATMVQGVLNGARKVAPTVRP